MTSLAVLSSEQEVRRSVIAEAPKEIKGLDIHGVVVPTPNQAQSPLTEPTTSN